MNISRYFNPELLKHYYKLENKNPKEIKNSKIWHEFRIIVIRSNLFSIVVYKICSIIF